MQLTFPTLQLRKRQPKLKTIIGTQIGTTSIAANTTSATISIPIKGDDDNEGNETFKVRIASPPDQLELRSRNFNN